MGRSMDFIRADWNLIPFSTPSRSDAFTFPAALRASSLPIFIGQAGQKASGKPFVFYGHGLQGIYDFSRRNYPLRLLFFLFLTLFCICICI